MSSGSRYQSRILEPVIVFLNGTFVPEEEATVSVFDRGFVYGDGLFETLRLYNGRPFRWDDHWERLRRGAEFLRIRPPFSSAELLSHVAELVLRNGMPDSVLRIVLSRGVGHRGYSPKGAPQPVLVMSLHAAPSSGPEQPLQWRLVTSSLRLAPDDPLAGFKTCNKIRHVLARAEAEEKGADEALLLNTTGEVAEAASANLFWIDDHAVWTPPLASGALPGVTRCVIFEICRTLALPCHEKRIRLKGLFAAAGVFLTVSTFEVIEVIAVDDHDLAHSPITARIHRTYRDLVCCEA